MGILTEALPRGQGSSESTVQSEMGSYKAVFLGMSDPFEWVSRFNEKCRACKGTKLSRDGNQDCFVCGGSGTRTEKHIKLTYELENGITEEEEVNFKLSPPGQGKDGTPLSPSTLFIRLRSLSRMREATPEQLDEWYSSLPKPIKIPCRVVIDENKNGTALKIASVMRPRPAETVSEQAKPTLEAADPYDSFPDEPLY